jgi:hypothetical protein
MYYRIQPRGKDLPLTPSEGIGEEEPTGYCVFFYAWQVWQADAPADRYGEEVIEIEAPEEAEYDLGDIEGVRLPLGVGRILRRWGLDEFASIFGFESAEEAQWEGEKTVSRFNSGRILGGANDEC